MQRIAVDQHAVGEDLAFRDRDVLKIDVEAVGAAARIDAQLDLRHGDAEIVDQPVAHALRQPGKGLLRHGGGQVAARPRPSRAGPAALCGPAGASPAPVCTG